MAVEITLAKRLDGKVERIRYSNEKWNGDPFLLSTFSMALEKAHLIRDPLAYVPTSDFVFDVCAIAKMLGWDVEKLIDTAADGSSLRPQVKNTIY